MQMRTKPVWEMPSKDGAPPASGRQSAMVRSMDADSRHGCRGAPATAPAAGRGCQATECTQSSCPTSTASAVTSRARPPAAKLSLGAYLQDSG